jgi:hypothetical protein
MTEPIVDTHASLDCANEDDVILSLFPELFEFVCDLKAELDASMDEELFQPNSGYNCPSVATAPTILMICLLDTKNQSNMMILSECHLTLYDTANCIANPLPLLDLPIKTGAIETSSPIGTGYKMKSSKNLHHQQLQQRHLKLMG